MLKSFFTAVVDFFLGLSTPVPVKDLKFLKLEFEELLIQFRYLDSEFNNTDDKIVLINKFFDITSPCTDRLDDLIFITTYLNSPKWTRYFDLRRLLEQFCERLLLIELDTTGIKKLVSCSLSSYDDSVYYGHVEGYVSKTNIFEKVPKKSVNDECERILNSHLHLMIKVLEQFILELR